jgi:hypothetical protein
MRNYILDTQYFTMNHSETQLVNNASKKMLCLKVITSLLLLIVSINYSKAQTIPSPVFMEVYMQKSKLDTTNLYKDTLFQINTQVIGKMVVKLADTINVQKIHVLIKSSQSSQTALFSKTFLYDQQGTFTDSTSYNRKAKILYFNIGTFIGLNSFYGEVKLESPSGYQTAPLMFINSL